MCFSILFQWSTVCSGYLIQLPMCSGSLSQLFKVCRQPVSVAQVIWLSDVSGQCFSGPYIVCSASWFQCSLVCCGILFLFVLAASLLQWSKVGSDSLFQSSILFLAACFSGLLYVLAASFSGPQCDLAAIFQGPMCVLTVCFIGPCVLAA